LRGRGSKVRSPRVAKERSKRLAEVASERADLHREITAMHKHKETQAGRVALNIGGYRFETSVQALRPVRAGRVR
jgi:hypothetical protein